MLWLAGLKKSREDLDFHVFHSLCKKDMVYEYHYLLLRQASEGATYHRVISFNGKY